MLAQRYADRRPYLMMTKRRPYKEHLLGRYPEYKPGLPEMVEAASVIEAMDSPLEARQMSQVLLWDLSQWLLAALLYRGGLSCDEERVQAQDILARLSLLVVGAPSLEVQSPVPDITMWQSATRSKE